jgi:hypothetical protein
MREACELVVTADDPDLYGKVQVNKAYYTQAKKYSAIFMTC